MGCEHWSCSTRLLSHTVRVHSNWSMLLCEREAEVTYMPHVPHCFFQNSEDEFQEGRARMLFHHEAFLAHYKAYHFSFFEYSWFILLNS